MKRRIQIFIVGFLALTVTMVAVSRPDWNYVEVDGRQRQYLLVEPAEMDKPLPVAFVLHGGGGNARKASRMGFSALAKERGYLVVYPNAVNGHWQVEIKGHHKYDPSINDVKFMEKLLDELSEKYTIDPGRVYATGSSNGGMMSHRIGVELSARFVAIAPTIGGVTTPLAKRFPPPNNVSVLIIQGTDDPLVPYDGGPITVGKKTYGKLESTDRAVELWVEANGCGGPETTDLPDSIEDGCSVTKTVWSGGGDGSEVILYKVKGGGHTLPGGIQYLPERVIGKVCRDFQAVTTIADFFDKHTRPEL
jgi:polyhydroxybutyrate depolymerase